MYLEPSIACRLVGSGIARREQCSYGNSMTDAKLRLHSGRGRGLSRSTQCTQHDCNGYLILTTAVMMTVLQLQYQHMIEETDLG